MPALAFSARLAALLLLAAIAGFFYAYWCSVMIGLDAAGAQTALPAMQAINRMVRNAMFAPAFFGPLIALPVAAALSWRAGADRSARLLAAALAVYGVGAFWVTVSANVPLNAELADIAVDAPDLEARWRHYLAYWGDWNGLRTAASFLALTLAALALRDEPCRRAGPPYLPHMTLHRDDERGTLTLDLGGGERAYATFRKRGDVLAITHTEVPPHLEGRGHGSALMRAVVDEARARGEKILPLCSFARAYMRRRPEDAALIATDF